MNNIIRDHFYNLATDKSKGFFAAIFRPFLFFLSLIYNLVIRILIFLNRLSPYKLDCKVISVGNITLGGTGKTVLVEFIAGYLKEAGHKAVVLSRGYKRKAIRYPLNAKRYEDMGDEPYMLSKKLGDTAVIVDKDRVRAARQAMKNCLADTVILDDGFQQWRINKDLDIVVIDAVNPFGNRQMLPRGVLREPISSLRRADIFVLTKTNLATAADKLKDFLARINPSAGIIESVHLPQGLYRLGNPRELLSLEMLKGKTAVLFSGIGDPSSFEKLIVNLGADIGLSFKFCDHYSYSDKDLEDIIQAAEVRGIEIIVTTEKDAARLGHLSTAACRLPIFVLRIELKITKNEKELVNRLSGLYKL